LKARENPFRIERVHQLRFRFSSGSMAELLTVLASNGYRGAIIGPHGSGKTTLLEELQKELHQQGFPVHPVRFTEAHGSTRGPLLAKWLESARENSLLILDGAEQLTPREWRAVEHQSTRHRGLIVTAHQPGFLTTIYCCRTSESLLAELVLELLGEQGKSALECGTLFRNHAGNIRDCLRELYDQTFKVK
jgi:hypothetical protein